MSKVFKKIRKIIPKEIRPALPALAAVFGPMALAKFGPAVFSGSGVLASLPARSMISSALAQAATEGKIDPKETALAGLQAYGGQKLQAIGEAGKFTEAGFLEGKPSFLSSLAGKAGEFLAPSSLEKIAQGQTLSNAQIFDAIKAGGKAAIPQASVAYAEEAKLLNEKALRDYEAQLREQGIMDSSERRNKIFGYFSNAGYDADEVNAFLDKYGYAYGGRVGYKKAGLVTLDDLINKTPSGELFMSQFKIEDEDEDEDEDKPRPKFSTKDLMSGLDYASKGLETAFGRPIDMKPQPTRFGLAEGGIPNTMAMRKTIAELIQAGVIDEEDVEEAIREIQGRAMMSMRAPGMAEGGIMNLGGREMDMRGGGFIPIGAKERADDVPARLSKNEFVMTADAVRAAGGGSINKGAKRMYDLMNKLESKV